MFGLYVTRRIVFELPKVAGAVLILQVTTPVAVTSYLLKNMVPAPQRFIGCVSTLLSVIYVQ